MFTSSASSRPRGTLLHRQIFLVLRDEIEKGAYIESGVLPKEEALAERFAVSRITLRRALSDLAATGLVERRHGVGTFVKPQAGTPRAAPSLTFIESLRQIASSTQVRVLKLERIASPPAISAALQLDAGEVALHAIRLRMVEDVPVMLTSAWVPHDIGRRVTAARLRKRAIYEVLQEESVQFGRVIQEITTQVATPDLAGPLEIEVGSPLLKLVRVMHDKDSRPVQHLTALLHPDHSRIISEIPGDKINTLDGGQVLHEVALSRHGRRD